MVNARGSVDAIRVSACARRGFCVAPPRLFICRSTERGWLVRQSVRHRYTKDNDAVCDKKRRWARWLVETVEAAGKKRMSENCEKKTERKMRRSDGDSENARAKGYEMKFSSHPFCVSEGIPVRREVPSWNRRKRKSELGRRERRKGRVDAGGEKEGQRAVVEMAVEWGCTELQDIVRGGFRDGEGREQGKLSAELRLYRHSQREGIPSTRKPPDIW